MLCSDLSKSKIELSKYPRGSIFALHGLMYRAAINPTLTVIAVGGDKKQTIPPLHWSQPQPSGVNSMGQTFKQAVKRPESELAAVICG